jgi:NAD(P)-dependent dehydrogenase (short-subunit alcohol dehydrogenase family)
VSATALVTGAQRGLGLALCRALHRRGDQVLATCLERTGELEALGVQIIDGIDVSSDAALSTLIPVLETTPPLDPVVSNAGINQGSGGFADADTDAMAREYNVNTLGAVRVVRTVLPFLAPRARIGFVTTGRGALFPRPDPAHGANYGYRLSKASLNVYAGLLAADLRDRGVCVALVHPGVMDTELLRRASGAGGAPMSVPGAVPPDDVAPDVIRHIEELPLERSGAWIAPDGTTLG